MGKIFITKCAKNVHNKIVPGLYLILANNPKCWQYIQETLLMLSLGRVVDDVFRTEELVLELVFLLNKVLTSVYIKKTVIHLYIFYIH